MGKINFNLDLSKINLKDLLKIFGTLKGLRVLSVLVWPGIILLACAGVLGAALIMGSGLKQKADKESVPMGNQIKGLLKTSPAAGQADVERRYQEAFQEDANKIRQLSIQSTKRELLSYDIFPAPKDTSTLLFTRFGVKYRSQIEGLITKINGGDCPSKEEIETAQKTVSNPGFARLTTQTSEVSSRVMDDICMAKAKLFSVYANADGVSGYDFWKSYQYTNMPDSIKDCWFWQISYWVIEDVFSTVGTMNAGSSSVISSPVKRVERVGFSTPDGLFGSGGTGGKGLQDRPKYVSKPDEQLTESFTKRVCNEDIDVVHFSAVVVLSSKAIIPFMRELCSAKEHKFMGFNGQEPAKVLKHNQITILESRVKPLSSISNAEHQYYRYGNDSIVELELVCEYIFNKKGYDEIKPDSVKNPDAKPAG